jgi:hypothetical protein
LGLRKSGSEEGISIIRSGGEESVRKDEPHKGAAGLSGDEVQREVIRAMTPERRWQTASRMYWAAREWKASALRALHPDWSEDLVKDAVRRSFLHVGQ